MTDPVPMGWLDRIVDLHFGGSFLYIVAAATEGADNGDGLAPPSITVTAAQAPQDNVSFTKLDEFNDPQQHHTEDIILNETIFTIWNPAVPLPDSTNINTSLLFNPGSISWVGQFMQLHENIVQDLLLFETPPIVVLPDGTFQSLSDAAASIKYMSRTTIDSWYTVNGAVVEAGYIHNFAVGIPVSIKIKGASLSSNVKKVLYSVGKSGRLSVDISCGGETSASNVQATLFVNSKEKIKKIADVEGKSGDTGAGSGAGGGAGGNSSGSHDYLVKFDASNPKQPTVTVS